ncbi:iron-sulfur cluster insertion protein ErpA [archaeon]|nr:iron-sulfur cluster insertion protein ErpA [archaeon]|tara:strand:+ start:3134 stop:3691 length:558 start_codon:yes stop_codon:yes gene_type:complete
MEQLQVLITKDMTISNVVSKYPSTIEVLQEEGIHCVGCSVSFTETLEEGFKSHGLSDQEVTNLIKKLNNSIKEEETIVSKELTLTKKAAEKIIELRKKSNKEDLNLRIKIEPGGCSGYSYRFSFDQASKEDKVVEQESVKLIFDKDSYNFIKGSKIDFVDSLQGSGFKVINPNAKSTCGCGQSFH